MLYFLSTLSSLSSVCQLKLIQELRQSQRTPKVTCFLEFGGGDDDDDDM